MKSLAVMLTLAVVACAKQLPFEPVDIESLTAFNYYERFGIPEAERIRKLEEELLKSPERIVGGSTSGLGQFPYQAGLLGEFVGITGTGVCGGSLISPNRVLTAAHCWFDGRNQAWRFTVVLGSITLFSGGTRVDTSQVVMHENWQPSLIRNDVAVIYLPTSVTLSDTISPIALPPTDESYAGEVGLVSGFGLTSDGGSITTNQVLSHVSLPIISNLQCSLSFPFIIQTSNICTSGAGGASTCSGDSGGPLTVMRGGRPVLIGVTSFGSALGCEIGLPAAFARVSFFRDFIGQNL